MTDAPGDARYASVAVPVPVRRLFTYAVRDEQRDDVRAGARVRVPLGGRTVVGTVVRYPAPPLDAGVAVKEILGVLPGGVRIGPEVLELTRFVADYYLCSWGEALEAAVPAEAATLRTARFVRRADRAPSPDPPSRAIAQRRALDALPRDGGWVPVASLPAADRRVLAALASAGRVEIDERPAASARSAVEAGSAPETPPEPTSAQAGVLGRLEPAVDRREFQPFLLYGATGSGKTEVYLRAAARAVSIGRRVLYLVPEIGLTALLVSKIERRFPGKVVVLHSGLPARDRATAWERARSGDCSVVVGTRSAVFAPIADTGLIVVDEEQDTSYKQSETPRYNGRDVAIVRGRAAGAVVLLGSATPSMESFGHARSGRYELLRLGPRIASRPLPDVRIVDMRLEFERTGQVTALSEDLLGELKACVGRGEQALVLRNRRGWAAALVCPTCGNRVECSRCSVSMTWHQAHGRLRCHHCGLEHPYPRECPSCGGTDLKMLGLGTERVEDTLREELPGTVIERMDRDTIRRRGSHEKLLRRFERREIQVLVGTQMIAKGHDFPAVTVVGVLSADQSLGVPDFRAAERTYQLLAQVAGRAGRGARPGMVVVQAFCPDHPVLRLAAAQEFEPFFEHEIRYRRALRYPPLTALVRLGVHDPDEHRARDWAGRLAESIRETGGRRLIVSGPGPAPVERLKGRFRQQILVRSAGRRRMVESVDRALKLVEGSVPRKAIVVDVDAVSLL